MKKYFKFSTAIRILLFLVLPIIWLITKSLSHQIGIFIFYTIIGGLIVNIIFNIFKRVKERIDFAKYILKKSFNEEYCKLIKSYNETSFERFKRKMKEMEDQYSNFFSKKQIEEFVIEAYQERKLFAYWEHKIKMNNKKTLAS